VFVARHRDAQPTITLFPHKPKENRRLTSLDIYTILQFILEDVIIVIILYTSASYTGGRGRRRQ
jgi:hypothetical protein